MSKHSFIASLSAFALLTAGMTGGWCGCAVAATSDGTAERHGPHAASGHAAAHNGVAADLPAPEHAGCGADCAGCADLAPIHPETPVAALFSTGGPQAAPLIDWHSALNAPPAPQRVIAPTSAAPPLIAATLVALKVLLLD